jgi:hypothetical protein
MASQEDTPRGRKVPNADFGYGGNATAERGLESRIREIRPSGLMRGRSWRQRTDHYGRFNLQPPAPAYSTTEFQEWRRNPKSEIRPPKGAPAGMPPNHVVKSTDAKPVLLRIEPWNFA